MAVAGMQDRGPTAKPFLGGWRNTVTGLIYHNAYTQTHDGGTTTRRSGITQTVALADAATEIARDRAVQVHFMPDASDRIVAPRISLAVASIERSESLSRRDNDRTVDSVITIQRCYRAHRARARTGAREKARVSRDEANETDETMEHTEHAKCQRATASYGAGFVVVKRGSPRTSSEFASLRNLLDRWRILEAERASRTLLGPSRIAACGLILSREVELLRAIDSLRAAVLFRCKERKRRAFLDELSRPIVWQDARGRSMLVDTLRVQRARQHRHVYTSLANENLSVAERVDLLHGLRRIAGMHTCDQSLELIYLVDQELALLACRVDTGRLNWLRNRLKLSFLKLARNALQGDLEEDAHRFGWSDSSITRLCRTCGRLLPLEKFPRERRLRSSSCVYCVSMRARREPRVVYEPYEWMLREVRRFEAQMGCYGSLAFVVGAKVVRRLVNEIWHGRSGISGCDDLDELRLTRFRRELEWAPWNSLVLTKTEAAVHRALADIEGFYDSRLLQTFCVRNIQARVYLESAADARGNVVTPSSPED